MNVIIIAACIPTLRPLCLLLFNQASASQYRPSLARPRASYRKAINSGDSSSQPKSGASRVNGVLQNEGSDSTAHLSPATGQKGFYERKRNNSILVDQGFSVESAELGSRDDDVEMGDGAGTWDEAKGSGAGASSRVMEISMDSGTNG